jgi:molybdopterin-containing oxidoreductase family molybdopterin binding subunit
VNGVAVKIEGQPASTMGASGGLCSKGTTSLQLLYDPNRLNVPLRRTNPEKGLFVDPKWEEITWEEAFDEIVPRMKKIISDNPKKIFWQWTTMRSCQRALTTWPFLDVIGTPHMAPGGGGLHCGEGSHPVAGMINASWSIVPDFRYCNYAIYVGSSKGVGSGHSAMIAARQAAEARDRGMKIVSLDPICNFSGGKATEWVPIIPGTDGAVILAMCNVIINELGIWDATYLKTKTNAPYLVGNDLHYIRDKVTNKPLVWDMSSKDAVPYDHQSIPDYETALTIDYALEGKYEVDGVECQPAFQHVRDHLKTYTPEMASKISTVPADRIRRIATEFAHAASIGSTMTIDGLTLPFRPASAVIFRGAEGHQNAFHTCFTVALLNQIVGSADVPGGTIGWPAKFHGYLGNDKYNWSPYMGQDGFLETERFGPWAGIGGRHGPWPPKKPKNEHTLNLGGHIFAQSNRWAYTHYWSDQEEIWQKVDVPYRPEMMLVWGCNPIMSVSNRDELDKIFKKYPFTVVYELFNTEFTEGYADIVLPATSFLEESSIEGMVGQNYNHPFGMDDWSCHIIQPVVEPVGSRRSWDSVQFELADRLGLREKFVAEINKRLDLEDEYKLTPTDDITADEIWDKTLKTRFGDEHDWAWFKEHGFMRWPKKVEEVYWRYLVDARVPIYLEWLSDMGDNIKKITDEIGLEVDFSQYTPFISWNPSIIHKEKDSEYDLYCFSYRDILHTGTMTMELPWLDEASRMNPYTYNITMNSETAIKKGIRDRDTIELETAYGRKVQGTVKLMEGQHPQTVGIAACSGHWAKGQPIARGKGTNFNMLLELDLKHVDPVSHNIETATRVKVRKVNTQSAKRIAHSVRNGER